MKGLHHYAYNSEYFFDEAPGHSRLPSGVHDVYLEAVIGAVFHDLGFDRCSEWVENTILPLMFRNDVDRNTKD
ncbi:MAG: hypothetical protein MJZ68_08500, partial [archaeon]|nr:hypothetical protein [archaeon]